MQRSLCGGGACWVWREVSSLFARSQIFNVSPKTAALIRWWVCSNKTPNETFLFVVAVWIHIQNLLIGGIWKVVTSKWRTMTLNFFLSDFRSSKGLISVPQTSPRGPPDTSNGSMTALQRVRWLKMVHEYSFQQNFISVTFWSKTFC